MTNVIKFPLKKNYKLKDLIETLEGEIDKEEHITSASISLSYEGGESHTIFSYDDPEELVDAVYDTVVYLDELLNSDSEDTAE